jgi:hypothetical protein
MLLTSAGFFPSTLTPSITKRRSPAELVMCVRENGRAVREQCVRMFADDVCCMCSKESRARGNAEECLARGATWLDKPARRSWSSLDNLMHF